MPSTSGLSFEALKTRSIKTGSTFPLDIMADHLRLLSVEPSSIDPGDRWRRRMPLSLVLAIVKDWILKWRWVRFWEEAPMSWENPSRSMRHGSMCLVLCCWMTGVSETSRLGNTFLWVPSQLKTEFQQFPHGLSLLKPLKAAKSHYQTNNLPLSNTYNRKTTFHTTSTWTSP